MKTIKRFLSFGSALVIGFSSLFFINFGTAFAAINCVWNGSASNNFNDSSNWDTCAGGVPNGVASVTFDNSSLGADATLTDDIPGGMSTDTLVFTGNGAHHFTLVAGIANDDITINSGISNTMTGCTSDSCYETIANNITFTGPSSLTVPTGGTATAFLDFTGDLSGSGLITISGDNGGVWLEGNNSGLTGGITSSVTSISVNSGTALGTGTTTISGTAELNVNFDVDTTFATPLSLGGTGGISTMYMSTLDSQNPAGDGVTATWSGPITLTSDVKIGGFGNRVLKVTGPLSGQFMMTPLEGDSNAVVSNASSNNTSDTPSGIVPITVASSDHQPGLAFTAYSTVPFILDGIRGNGTVQDGGILEGTGTVGTLDVQSGGTVAPGHSPGCLNSGNFSLAGTYQAEIGGTTACTGYDQMKVTGTVNVTGGTLSASLYNSYAPKAGEVYTIIDNDGADAVTGTFTGLAEGATVTVGGVVLKVSYVGGTGNDVTLTVVSVPATPDTGFNMLKTNPLLTLSVTSLTAGGMLVASRRYAKLGK